MAYNPHSVYARNQNAGASARTLEARAFHQAARLLETCEDPEATLRAVAFNRRLWTLVQADVTDAANDLPQSAKADLLSLSFFMERGLTDLAQGRKAPVQAMADVNRQIASAQLEPR